MSEFQEPIDKAAIELIVLGLYRLGKISSGRAAAVLNMPRLDFIQNASDLGIPYLRVTADDLDSEIRSARSARCYFRLWEEIVRHRLPELPGDGNRMTSLMGNVICGTKAEICGSSARPRVFDAGQTKAWLPAARNSDNRS
jgi:hypothetical protein